MKRNIGIYLVIAILACVSLPGKEAYGRKIRVRHTAEKTGKSPSEKHQEESRMLSISADSTATWREYRDKIKLYGYDKTVNSTKESLFAVNGLDSCTVREITLELLYSDIKGRQLHRREVKITCELPGGETRRIDFPTWDTQKSFYYHKSAVPRRQATPFKVEAEVTGLLISRD